jgi:hypothetical protein
MGFSLRCGWACATWRSSVPQEYSVYQFETGKSMYPLFVYQKKSLNVYLAVNSTAIYEQMSASDHAEQEQLCRRSHAG